MTQQCDYPKGAPESERCHRRVVAVFERDGERLHRCARHDGRGARISAEMGGWVRRAVAA